MAVGDVRVSVRGKQGEVFVGEVSPGSGKAGKTL